MKNQQPPNYIRELYKNTNTTTNNNSNRKKQVNKEYTLYICEVLLNGRYIFNITRYSAFHSLLYFHQAINKQVLVFDVRQNATTNVDGTLNNIVLPFCLRLPYIPSQRHAVLLFCVNKPHGKCSQCVQANYKTSFSPKPDRYCYY